MAVVKAVAWSWRRILFSQRNFQRCLIQESVARKCVEGYGNEYRLPESPSSSFSDSSESRSICPSIVSDEM